MDLSNWLLTENKFFQRLISQGIMRRGMTILRLLAVVSNRHCENSVKKIFLRDSTQIPRAFQQILTTKKTYCYTSKKIDEGKPVNLKWGLVNQSLSKRRLFRHRAENIRRLLTEIELTVRMVDFQQYH